MRIGTLRELQRKGSLKFAYRQEGIEREGFVVWFNSQAIAYENACRHIPIPLDYGDSQFFTADRQSLLCQNHGAVYNPITGICLRGPCPGTRLKKLDVRVVDGDLIYEEEPRS